MNILPIIDAAEKEMQDIYEDLHAHPELGFEEVRTSAIVAEKLREFGVDEVHTGLGKTGVVGIIQGKSQGSTPGQVAMNTKENGIEAYPMEWEP